MRNGYIRIKEIDLFRDAVANGVIARQDSTNAPGQEHLRGTLVSTKT
jgi:hypothetical protein